MAKFEDKVFNRLSAAAQTYLNNNLTAVSLWRAIKQSNQNTDGSITISAEKVKNIDKVVGD